MRFQPTREEIQEATRRFLLHGGTIRQLPDTVEEQKRRLFYQFWVEEQEYTKLDCDTKQDRDTELDGDI